MTFDVLVKDIWYVPGLLTPDIWYDIDLLSPDHQKVFFPFCQTYERALFDIARNIQLRDVLGQTS